MRFLKATIVTLLTVCVAVPLLLIATVYASTWYYRHRAERVLDLAKASRLGATKEKDFRAGLESLGNKVYFFNYDKPPYGPPYVTESVQVYNSPPWLDTLAQHTPDPIREWVGKYLMNDSVSFSVDGRFQNGFMTGLHMYEFSCPWACGHPFASIVSIYTYRNSVDEYYRLLDGPFDGYQVYPTMVSDIMGKPLKAPVLFKQFVLIDDRGSAEQRRAALDFHLQCFTDWFGCRDASEMLQPMPNR